MKDKISDKLRIEHAEEQWKLQLKQSETQQKYFEEELAQINTSPCLSVFLVNRTAEVKQYYIFI